MSEINIIQTLCLPLVLKSWAKTILHHARPSLTCFFLLLLKSWTRQNASIHRAQVHTRSPRLSVNVCFGKQAVRCMRSEQYLQSSKVVPGEDSARRLRNSSRSRVTCRSCNRTVSIFSCTWWLSMWAGGGEEAWPGVPVGVSMSLVACAIHRAQMMEMMCAASSTKGKCIAHVYLIKLCSLGFSALYWKLANSKHQKEYLNS